MNKPISVYAPNLKCRADRRASIEAQFEGKSEFNLTVVEAIENRNGPWGLWQTFYGIVEREATKGSDYFIFCEDDHVFTDNYSFSVLAERIAQAQAHDADLLSGGMSVMETPVGIATGLFWVSKFNGMQFTVIFNRLYDKILACRTDEGYVTDIHLSYIAKRKYVMYPFISVQKEFGYSDATSLNAMKGRVSGFFSDTEELLGLLSKTRAHYAGLSSQVVDSIMSMNVENAYVPAYIINLKERTDRLAHIQKQFSDKPEFKVSLFEACRDSNGAVGLWNSICAIVNRAKADGEEYVLICEDDHFFTEHYDRSTFLRQIMLAGVYGAELLSGGIGGFGNLVPVSGGLAWVDWLWCTQFIVVYSNAYDKILNAPFGVRDVADEKLSSLLKSKFVITPFISEQTDFGYSDVTEANNNSLKIRQHFDEARRKTRHYIAAYGNIPDSISVNDYMSSSQIKSIQIGCGYNLLPGWLNTDVEPDYGVTFLDAMKPWNLSDNTIDYILAEHLLEWLSPDECVKCLRECYRILKTGGVLRITVFSCEKFLNTDSLDDVYKYLKILSPDIRVQTDRVFALQIFLHRMQKLLLMDYESISQMITAIGFSRITKETCGQSQSQNLRGVESHKYYVPQAVIDYETLTVEVTK